MADLNAGGRHDGDRAASREARGTVPGTATGTPAGAVATPLVEAAGVDKRYGPIRVLAEVDFSVLPGEVHALLGENGAGKSTLLKILSGLVQPSAGVLRVGGSEVRFASPHEARAAGVATVYQETSLFPDLSVAENIFLANAPAGAGGVLDWPAMRDGAVALLARLDCHDLDVDAPARGLSVAHKQQVEIARALALDAKVIILDEPTTALNDSDVDKLLAIVRQLRASGVGLVYVSHRLPEIFRIADRVTVLRDGRRISTRDIGAVTQDSLITDMVGRPLEAIFPTTPDPTGPVRLSVDGLGVGTWLRDISFEVRRGEILGIAGLVGSGRTTLAQTLFGIHAPTSGRIAIDGETVAIAGPRAAIGLGLAYVPEDRGRQGLVLAQSIRDNLNLPILKRLAGRFLRNGAAEDASAADYAARYRVKASSINERIINLSGGNQQKTLVAKWMAIRPRVLILDEPTRGVDIGAKAEIYRLIADALAEGLAIVLISSELPEVLGLAHTVIVMSEGRVAARFDRASVTAERVGLAMTGTIGEAAAA